MIALIKALQVILALSILILLHELGHFTFAKMFKIRVDKFFLFFDLGGVSLFSTKKTRWFLKLFPQAASWETEYGIGWLPLGGYCKICGMVDESMDFDALKQEPQPWEFRSKGPWKRLLVMAGGVLNNFIFAIAAYCLIMGIWGEAFIENAGSKIYVNELSYEMGFRTGDEILAFDDYVPEDFSMLQADLARRDVRKAVVLRGADTVNIYIDQAMTGQVLNTPGMFDLAFPFIIDSIAPASPNKALCRYDRIIGVDGKKAEWAQDSRAIISSLAGSEVPVQIVRGADTLSVPVQIDSAGRLGVFMAIPNISTRKYGVFSSIPAGFKAAGQSVSGYLHDLRLLAKPSTGAYKSVGSFIAIGQVFPASWDWYQFLQILALLSIMLGVMNLLPIPGLDGGHILFTLIEIVSGRKPSDRFLEIAQMVGMVLLVLLMLLAFGNDIGRLIH